MDRLDFIKEILTFRRWRRAQNWKGVWFREKSKGIGRQYNKDVGGRNKAVSWQAYGSGGYNKENDEETRSRF